MDGNEKDFVTNQDALAEAQAQIAQAQVVQSQMQAQAQAQAAAAKKKKGSKGWIIWIIAILGAAAYFGYNYFFAFKPTFKVDNYEFTLKTTVKELRDNNIVLCDSSKKESDNNASVRGRTIYSITYNLGVKKGGVIKDTGLVVQLANFRSSNCSLNECAIYKIYYYPEYQSADVTVLINGQDFSTAKIDSNLKSKIKDAKIPFKDSEIDDLINGKSNTLIDDNSSYRFEFSKRTGTKDELLIEFWRNVDVSVKSK